MYWLILCSLIYIIVIFILTLRYKDTNSSYLWHLKNISGEPYYPKYLCNDAHKLLQEFSNYLSPLFISIKIFVYLFYFVIKIIQLIFAVLYVLYYIIAYIKLILYNNANISFQFYIDPRLRFIDFLQLIFIKIPKSRVYNIFYSITLRFFSNTKAKINIKRILYNFISTRIFGLSIWTIFMLDLISIEIYSSFYDEELSEKPLFKVWWQILCRNLNNLFLNVLNLGLIKSRESRITKKDNKITFNPIIKLSKRHMFNLFGKTISNRSTQHTPSAETIKSPNNKEHAAIRVAVSDDLISGPILTHTPKNGQTYISVEKSTGSKDIRPQKFTTNTGWSSDCSRNISPALLDKTGLNNPDRLKGFANIDSLVKASNYNKFAHYQDKNGFTMLDLKTPKLSPKSSNRNHTLALKFEETKHPNFSSSMDKMDKETKHRLLENIKSLHNQLNPNEFFKHFNDDDRVIENALKIRQHSTGNTINHSAKNKIITDSHDDDPTL